MTIKTDRKVAVVILNWNGATMMRRFLPSVVKGTGTDGTVIVADNGSTDDSQECVTKEFPEVEWLPLGENFGFAEGYNRALAQVEAPFFLLLNSDVEVGEHWLRPMIDFMEANPDVAACQPKLCAQSDHGSFEYAGAAGGFIDRYGYPFCRGRIMESVERDTGQYDSPCDLFWATGAALLIRREDWENAGGLDGRFFAHQEEIDLCWRLRARGRRVVCVPQSVAYHVGGGTLDAGNPRKTFLNFRNNLFMLYKNLPADEIGWVMGVRRLLDWVAATKFLLTGDVKNFRAVVKARKEYARRRTEFYADRQHNLALSVDGGLHIPERMNGSLLFLYYAKGVRTFSALQRHVKKGTTK
ncbi:MAG: glycosyltransferase family 2 protein [Alloprevotella sp.]